MKVFVFNQQNDLVLCTTSVKPVVEKILRWEKQKSNEVAVYFVTTEEISCLHKEFFNDSTPTDCISFPMDREQMTGYHILGEIFICPKIALDYVLKTAEEINEQCYYELTLYLVHGLLHLIGYKDIDEKDAKRMHTKQLYHMEALIRQKILLSR